MDAIRQLTKSECASIREAFKSIESALLNAYQDARQHIQGMGYDERIVQTLFAQLLYHDVQRHVLQLRGTSPDLKVYLNPNSGAGSSHHLRLEIHRWVITIHAVRHIYDRLRFAQHRETYTRQWSFVADKYNVFVPKPPALIDEDSKIYTQILHASEVTGLSERRMYLGFIRVAYPDLWFGGYVKSAETLDDFLDANFGPYVVAEEKIEDTFGELTLRQDVDGVNQP